MHIYTRGIKNIALLGASIVAAVLCMTTPTYAAPYGVGPYGSCPLQTDCPDNTPATSGGTQSPGGGTIATTPTGLDVAINLNNGQVLPNNGYTVTVSPLTTDGKGIDKAEFYLDGRLVATLRPGSDGNVNWPWDTSSLTGTHTIKIIIYATDGSTVTKEFTISIAARDEPQAPTANTGQKNDGGFFGGIIGFASGIVRSLPTPIVVSLPYVLLLLLLLIILLLYLQSRREAREIRELEAYTQKGRLLEEEKRGFIQLTSHYLRTPITIIKGGVDMLRTNNTNPNTVNQISSATDSLYTNSEDLLSNTAKTINSGINASDGVAGKEIWLRPTFWLPIVLIGLLLLGVNLIIANTDRFSDSQLNWLTQLALFVALAVGLYVVLRSSILTKRARQRAAYEEQQQAAVDQARNTFIKGSASTLGQSLESIRSAITQLPSSKAVNFIADGCQRADELLKKFQAAGAITPIRPDTPFTNTDLAQLLAPADSSIKTAQTKDIHLTTSGDAHISTQQPQWLSTVLASLIDNAVAYSDNGSEVHIAVGHERGKTSISVRDHGKGIEQAKLDELFQPFSRTETGMTVDHPGIGFSLYLDRLLMTNLGGTISIDSQPGKGTLATITFPSA